MTTLNAARASVGGGEARTFAVSIFPRTERVLVVVPVGHGRHHLALVLVEEVVARVIEDHVQQHVHAHRVRKLHELDEVFARAEVWVNLQEVLDRIPVTHDTHDTHDTRHKSPPSARDNQRHAALGCAATDPW